MFIKKRDKSICHKLRKVYIYKYVYIYMYIYIYILYIYILHILYIYIYNIFLVENKFRQQLWTQ